MGLSQMFGFENGFLILTFWRALYFQGIFTFFTQYKDLIFYTYFSLSLSEGPFFTFLIQKPTFTKNASKYFKIPFLK